jgi:uncharacterized protein
LIQVSYQVQGETIRGTLHLPEDYEGNVPGVLIIPGFADTAVGPHNLHVQMAKALVKQGFGVLRFDYRGQGESDGNFANFTIQTGLVDALEGLKYLQSYHKIDSSRLGVVGFSLGGTMAVQLASEMEEVKALSLLAPVAFPEKVFLSFFEQDHFEQANNRGWMDWLGWRVGKGFIDSLNSINPLKAMDTFNAKTITFQGTNDTEVPTENGEAFANKGSEIIWLKGLDHQYSSFVQAQTVINKSCEWFKKYI